MLVKLFTTSSLDISLRYMLRGGGCNINFCFFPHNYCSLPILNLIVAPRRVKLDILDKSSFRFLHFATYATLCPNFLCQKFGATFLCYRQWISVSCDHMTYVFGLRRKKVLPAYCHFNCFLYYILYLFFYKSKKNINSSAILQFLDGCLYFRFSYWQDEI